MGALDGYDIANTTVTDLFKTEFLNVLSSQFNKQHPILSMIRRDINMVGNRQSHGVKFADTGGFSAGSIGEASDTDFKQTNYTAKQFYVTGLIDAKSIKLARNDEGSFMRLLAMTIADMQSANTRNWARMLFNDGTGALGTIDASGVTDNGSGNYTVIVTEGTFKRANFRKRDLLNVSDGSSDLFSVESVVRSTRAVTIQRISGSKVPADGEIMYRQNSEDQEAEGLKGVLDATSGSKYGINIGDGWQATQVAAGGSAINSDILVDAMYTVMDEFGEMPDILVAGVTQMKKLVQLGDANKVLSYKSVSENDFVLGNSPHLFLEGKEIPIIYDQNVDDDRIYLLNKNHVTIRTTGKGEFEKGPQGFLHHELLVGNDRYKILFKTYGEIFINPTAHAVIDGLSTTTT